MNTRYRRRRYSIHPTARRTPWGRSPGDRAPPRFPPEPPPLARATPEGRAAAAQEGSASLWWARASAPHNRKATLTLELAPDRLGSPIARTDRSCSSSPSTVHSPESPSHASPPRPLSIGQHDTSAGTGGRNASHLEVSNPGAGASEIPGAHQQRSLGQSGTTAAQRQRPISFAPPARSRHRRRAAGDLDALHRSGNPTDASRRDSGSTGVWKFAVRAGNRGRRPTAADGSRSDGAGRGKTAQDDKASRFGQSWTEQ